MKTKKRIIATILVIILLAFSVINHTNIKNAFRKLHLDVRDRLNEGQGAWYMIDYSRYLWEISLAFENVAIVRFVERIPHFCKEKRAEYLFEVIEWIQGGNGECEISVVSPYSKSTFSYSVMESVEELQGYVYEVGKEYILPLSYYDFDGRYMLMHVYDHYQPIDAEITVRSIDSFWEMFVSVAYPEGVETLSKEEFLNCIRSAYNDPEVFKAAAMEIQTERERPVEDETNG